MVLKVKDNTATFIFSDNSLIRKLKPHENNYGLYSTSHLSKVNPFTYVYTRRHPLSNSKPQLQQFSPTLLRHYPPPSLLGDFHQANIPSFYHYFFYHQEALPPLLHFFAPFTTKFIKRRICFQSLLQFSLEPTPPKLIMKVTNNLHIAKSNGLISAFLLFGLSATSGTDVTFFPRYGSSLHFQDITISWLSFHLTSYY